MQTSRIFGFDIFSSSKKELFAHFDSFLVTKRLVKTQIVFTPNSEQIVMAKSDRSFAKALQGADWLLPDGMGLVYASFLLKFLAKQIKKFKKELPE